MVRIALKHLALGSIAEEPIDTMYLRAREQEALVQVPEAPGVSALIHATHADHGDDGGLGILEALILPMVLNAWAVRAVVHWRPEVEAFEHGSVMQQTSIAGALP